MAGYPAPDGQPAWRCIRAQRVHEGLWQVAAQPRHTKRSSGVTAYAPSPPISAAKTASEWQRGAHIQTMSPRGPIRAPRSPSAISAYSRSTCGGNAPPSMARSPPPLTSSGVTGYPCPAYTNPVLRPGTSAGRGSVAGRRADGSWNAEGQPNPKRDVWSPACPVGEWVQGNRHGRGRIGPGHAYNRQCQPADGERREAGAWWSRRAGCARRTPGASAVPEPVLPLA